MYCLLCAAVFRVVYVLSFILIILYLHAVLTHTYTHRGNFVVMNIYRIRLPDEHQGRFLCYFFLSFILSSATFYQLVSLYAGKRLNNRAISSGEKYS